MTSVSMSLEVPSARAIRQLNNRNNIADLYLRKRLEQMEREKNFLISHLDRDRLDMTDFLKHIRQCDSDDLPQAKLFMGEDEEEDDSLPELHPRRQIHTAKTAPPRLRGRRHKDDDDDDEDLLSLDDNFHTRSVATVAATRRQMLSRRRKEDEMRKISDYERAEAFLRRLREEAARERLDEVEAHRTRREFTAFLLQRIRTGTVGGFDDDDDDDFDDMSQDGTWAKARMDLVYPIKRLGDIASRFQKRESGEAGVKRRFRPKGTSSPTNLYNPSAPFIQPSGGRSGGVWVKGTGGGAEREDSAGKSGTRVGRGRARNRGRGANGEVQEKATDSNNLPEANEENAESAQASRAEQRLRSVFEITEDDVPASLMPLPPGMPVFNRNRRDTVDDIARAFGFGEAAMIVRKQRSPSSGSRSPSAKTRNPFSKAAIAERLRAQNRSPPKQNLRSLLARKPPPTKVDDPKGTEMMKAILQIKSRFRHKPLDDRVREFIDEIKTLTHPGDKEKPEDEEN